MHVLGILWTPCILYTVMCAVTKYIDLTLYKKVYGDFVDTLYTVYCDVRSKKSIWGFCGHLVYCIL